jgi:hypothetical protein
MYLWKLLMASTLAATLPATATAQVGVQDPDIADEPIELTDSHWLASGFVGSNFGNDADEASLDYGGTVGYLWRGVFGGEFAASFSPDFQFEPGRSALLGGEEPWVNSYMANAIAALPVGDTGAFRPYISGGLGALTLRADAIGETDPDAFEVDDTRFAGNIGGGVMAFGDTVGFRGDVRYYRGFQQDADADPAESPEEVVGTQILSELGFWRANVGLAFRF